MAFTHDDVYKPLPGYQVMVSHFHFHFNEELTDAGTLDHQPPWIPTFKALGINIAALCDFHADSHPTDTGKIRLEEQRVYFEGSERFSDRDFLIIPGEEPDATLGGHYMFLFPKPVYYTHAPLRREVPAQPARRTAVCRRHRALRQGLSHVVARNRDASAERRARADVADASAHQEFRRLPRRREGQAAFSQRPLRRRVVPVIACGSIAEASLRSALPRTAGRHE